MSMLRNMLMAVGEPAYVANAVRFDGITDRIQKTSQLTGAADTKLFTLSCWVKREFGPSGTAALFSKFVAAGGANGGSVQVNGTSASSGIQMRNSSNSTILQVTGLSPFTQDTWVHIFISFDLSDTGKRHIFVDGSAISPTYGTYTNDNIDFTVSDILIARLTTSGVLYQGDMADLYVNYGTFIDPTVTANLRKFIDVAGKPVNLGETGEKPTGSSPIIYLSKRDSEVANDFATNKGTGGTLTLVGSLDASSTSPSD